MPDRQGAMPSDPDRDLALDPVRATEAAARHLGLHRGKSSLIARAG